MTQFQVILRYAVATKNDVSDANFIPFFKEMRLPFVPFVGLQISDWRTMFVATIESVSYEFPEERFILNCGVDNNWMNEEPPYIGGVSIVVEALIDSGWEPGWPDTPEANAKIAEWMQEAESD